MTNGQVELSGDTGAGPGALPRARVLRPIVSKAVLLPTGPALMVALMQLMGRDDLSARELLEVTVAWKSLIEFCTAAQLSAVGDLDRQLNATSAGVVGTSKGVAKGALTDSELRTVRRTADELAPALRIAPRAASAMVALVRRTEDLPTAMDALAEGRMDLTQLRILDGTVRGLPLAATRALEDAAVRWAPGRTAAQFRADVTAEAMRVDPEHAVRAVARGTEERDVQLRPSPLPGCRRLIADMPLVDATACWLALNGTARAVRRAGGARTMPQLRADHLVAVLTGQSASGPAAVPTADELSRHAQVHVFVAADTLTGESELAGHLPGVGPVDPGTARELAVGASWRRLVADSSTGALVHADSTVLSPRPPPPDGVTPAGMTPDGVTPDGVTPAGSARLVDHRLALLHALPMTPTRLDHGTTRYSAPPPLRLHVLTRDAGCIGPACHHPPSAPQLDHTTNYGEQDVHGLVGTTGHQNLGAVCDRVHDAKTHGGWELTQPTPGRFLWTSPTGRSYARPARALIHGWTDLPTPPTRNDRPPAPG